MRWTTLVIQRFFSEKRFYTGRQPRYPSGHLYGRRKFKSLARTRCPSGHLNVLVLNLPSRSPAFTCRYTEPLVHLYYIQNARNYQYYI